MMVNERNNIIAKKYWKNIMLVYRKIRLDVEQRVSNCFYELCKTRLEVRLHRFQFHLRKLQTFRSRILAYLLLFIQNLEIIKIMNIIQIL